MQRDTVTDVVATPVAPTSFATGHIKRDPVTGDSAHRTSFPEVGALARHAWLVSTHDSGAVTKTTAEVAHWDDIYTPGD